MRRRTLPLGFVVLGFALLANPLYLDAMLVYPTAGAGFAIGAHYHAALSGLGFVLALVGFAFAADAPERYRTVPVVLSVAFATVLLFVLYERLVTGAMDPRETRILGYGHRKTVIASAVAVAFAASAAVAADEWRGAGAALLVLVPGIVLAASEETVLVLPFDLLLLFVSSDLLGVPFLGLVPLAGAILFGVWFGLVTGLGRDGPAATTITDES